MPGRRKILIVDDETELTKLYSVLMESLNLEVSSAESGNKALELMESEKFDVVLSDFMMDDGDGAELLQGIKDKGHEVPLFVILTGYSNINVGELKSLGASEVMDKPLSMKDFAQLLENHSWST